MRDFWKESFKRGAVPAAAVATASFLTEPGAAFLSPTWKPHVAEAPFPPHTFNLDIIIISHLNFCNHF